MALVTVQRSPSPSNTPDSVSSELGEDALDGVAVDTLVESEGSLRSPNRARSFSESYFAVKGAALILPQSQCPRKVTHTAQGGDIQSHLQSMFYLLRPQDTIKVAVKLECVQSTRHRYMVLVSTQGRQDTEECVLLGIDIMEQTTIGLLLPIWGDTSIRLDGDGGFKVKSNDKTHIFKPVSVQAMWSALQSIIKARDTAYTHLYHPGGLTHTWITYYEVRVKSEAVCIKEWNFMEDIEHSQGDPTAVIESDEEAQLQRTIKMKLKELMMTVDLEEVTSKYLRLRLEESLGLNLKEYRHLIDEETIVIMRQMDAPSEIFSFLYLGSEWNASNLEELQQNGIGYILNVTREIANFFQGMFNYKNIRLYDKESSELLRHWDSTYRFIQRARHNNSKVLIHCKMGVSRSASTVIAFAMKEYGWTLQYAYDYVKQKRSCIKPNKGFMNQLVIYEGILDASKQRHSSLWRSKSVDNLKNGGPHLSRRQEETDEWTIPDQEDPTNVGPETARPRSWSPEDNTTRLLLKARELTSEEDSSDADTQITGADGPADHEPPPELDDSVPLLFPPWNEPFDSQSADSLDEVLADRSSPQPEFEHPRRPSVVLLSHHTRESSSSSDSEMEELSTDSSEIDDLAEEDQAEENPRPERGFYDVSMLNMRLGCESVPEDGEPPQYYLHPDIKIELLMALLKKHRRTAQLLRLSQPPSPPATNEEPDLIDIEEPGPSMVASFTKVRSDTSWIREIPPSPQQPTAAQCPVLSSSPSTSSPDTLLDVPPLDQLTQTSGSSPEDAAGTADNIIPSVSPAVSDTTETQPEAAVTETTTTTTTPPSCSSASVSPPFVEAKETTSDSDQENQSILHRYQQEEIPWESGRVKRHTKDLEEKIRDHHDSGSASPCSSLEGIDFTNYETALGEIVAAKIEDVDQESVPMQNLEDEAKARPTSIYESEDIDLEPGLVKRTKHEIEANYRLWLELEETKPVQRTSSLKTEKRKRGYRKDRDSERRKTCQPVLHTVSSSLQTGATSGEEGEVKEGEGVTYALQIGSEVVEMEPGKVLKQKRDFEERYPDTAKSPVSDSEMAPLSPGRESRVAELKGKNVSSAGRSRVGSDSNLKSAMCTELSDSDSSPSDGSPTRPNILTGRKGQSLRVSRPSSAQESSAFVEFNGSKAGEVRSPGREDCSAGREPSPAYKEEAITWSVGTVKQHKEAIEGKTRGSTSSSEAVSPQMPVRTIVSPTTSESPPKGTAESFNEKSSGTKDDYSSGVTKKHLVTSGDELQNPKMSGGESQKQPASGGETQKRRLIIIEKNPSDRVSSPTSVTQGSPSTAEISLGRSSSFKDKVPVHRPVKHAAPAQQLKSAPATKSPEDQGNGAQKVGHSTISPFMTATPYGQRPQSLASPPKHRPVAAPQTLTKEDTQSKSSTRTDDTSDIPISREVVPEKVLEPNDIEVNVHDLVGIFEPPPTDSPTESVHKLPGDNSLSPPRPVTVATSTSPRLQHHTGSPKPETAAGERSSSLLHNTSKASQKSRPYSEEVRSPESQRTSVHLTLERQQSLPIKNVSGVSDTKVRSISDSPQPAVQPCRRTMSDNRGTTVSDNKGTTNAQVHLVTTREPDHSQVPRRSRKLHGKTHPLARLSGEESSAGRTPNPLYNTM